MSRPTECRYCGEKSILQNGVREIVFMCGSASWTNGVWQASATCRTNCLYQAAELRERINVITKERDEAIERERCLTSELMAKQKMWDTHYRQLNAIQEELNGELAEARKQIDRLEKGIHQSRCHIQNMADYYEKGD